MARSGFPFIIVWMMLLAPVLGQSGPAPVAVAPVRSGQAEITRPLVATVEAVVRSTLAAEEGGLVAERLFDEGSPVRKGDLLVRVKTDLLEAQLEAARASVVALEAQIEQADAERARALQEVERMRPVIEQKAAPQMQMDDAVRDLRVAEAIMSNRRAMVQEKQAEQARLKLMLAKSEVRAPFDGYVARRHVEVGQWINQGAAVAELVQLDPLHVRASVPESLAARLERGMPVRIVIDALGSDAVEGKIDQILPEADPLSRTVAVKVLLPNPAGNVRPGYLARATFLSRSDADLWIVPKDAVVRGPDGARVVALRQGMAALVPVQVVNFTGESAAVEGALSADDVVVIRGNEPLRGGEPLMPLGGPSPGAASAQAAPSSDQP